LNQKVLSKKRFFQKEDRYMKDAIDNCIRFVAEDLKVAEIALKEGIYNQVCFHSEQCVEKALKAFLASQGKSYPRSHKLTDLIASIPKDPLKSFEKI